MRAPGLHHRQEWTFVDGGTSRTMVFDLARRR